MRNDSRSCERNLCNCVRKLVGNNSLEVLNFFQPSYAIASEIAFTTARIILDLISFPQVLYDLFHLHLTVVHVRPRPNVELFMRRTKLSESRS